MLKKLETWQTGLSLASIGLSLLGLATVVKTKKEITSVKHDLARQACQFNNQYPFVSVIVPARNEEKLIEGCLNSILDQDYPNFEVIAVNDHSTDRTGALLARLVQKSSGSLRVVDGLAPEKDWLGKNNALWQGYINTNAKSEWLLFVDADTQLSPLAIQVAVNYGLDNQLDLLSFAPDMTLTDFWSRTLAVEVGKFYQFAANNPFQSAKPDSVEAADAVGPFILARREAYARSGGHRTVRNYVLEDVELARTFRAAGFSTRLIFGFDYLKMTPYEGLGDLWESVSKNLFLVGRKSWLTVAYVIGIECLYGLAPTGLFITSLINAKNQSRTTRLLNLTAIAFLVGLHSELGAIFHVPRRYALLYPLSAVLTSLIMLDSAIRVSLHRAIRWKGREAKID